MQKSAGDPPILFTFEVIVAVLPDVAVEPSVGPS